jgi:hypothetical protein
MARNWQYPRWRRLLMQLAMWVILGGTVGLAALLDRHAEEGSQVALAPGALQCGEIKLLLPTRWQIEISNEEPGVMTATDLALHFPRIRSVEITVAPPSEPGLIDHLLEKEASDDAPEEIAFTPTGNRPGKLYIWQQSADDENQPLAEDQVIATAVLQDGPEVTIRLKHADRDDQSLDVEGDVDLVRRIAATVKISPPAPSAD